MQYDFSKHRFRCSSLGHLLTEPKTKPERDAGELSESAKTHCMDIFISQQYGRQTDIDNKYIRKGLQVEEDAITIYSRVNKVFYKNNKTRLFNDFIQGEPDIFTGESVYKAETVDDIKSSWDIFTFFRTYGKQLKSLYEWQLRGYFWLTGAETGCIANVLVNTPPALIQAEKNKLWYKLGQPGPDNENWIDAQAVLDRAFTYDDIPLNQRVIKHNIERDKSLEKQIELQVRKARGYLVKLQSELCT